MKRILISGFALLVLGLGVSAYMYTTPGAGAKSVITYELRQGSTVTGTKIRTQNKNFNFSEETTYLNASPEPNRLQYHTCIIGNGMYEINHSAGSLRYMSKCEVGYISQETMEASANYSQTTTFLGYTVVVLTNNGITSYFSPALQTFLKHDLGEGRVVEAVNVNITSVPSVVLPAYNVVSYDDYKDDLAAQLEANVITQAEYNALYAEIPSQFQ